MCLMQATVGEVTT